MIFHLSLCSLLVVLFRCQFTCAVTTDKICFRLYFKGLDNSNLFSYPQLSGVYYFTNQTIDTFPVYRHEAYPSSLFIYNGTSKYFQISSYKLAFDLTLGSALPNMTSKYPFSKRIRQWYVYDNPAEQRFSVFDASTIQLTCIGDEGFRTCDTGSLEFTFPLTINNINVTTFSIEPGLYQNLRPVYRSVETYPGLYLYHHSGAWKISASLGSDTAFARVFDFALRPEFIEDTWNIFIAENVPKKWNAKLMCRGFNSSIRCSGPQALTCQNGGTCVEVMNRTTSCVCPLGYEGLTCQQRARTCQSFVTWLKDKNGFYFSPDNVYGSVATFFCPLGNTPRFNLSVCQSTGWSNLPICLTSPLPSTTLPSIRSSTTTWHWLPPITYPAKTSVEDVKKTFDQQNSWLLPIISVFVIVMQFVVPFIIYFVMVCCLGYNQSQSSQYKAADETENKAIAEMFREELAAFSARHPEPDSEYSPEALNELSDIEQRLETEVSRITVLRRQRNSMKKKSVKLCRLLSLYCYISLPLWIVFFVVALSIKVGQYGLVFTVIIILGLISLAILSIVLYVDGCCCSEERQYVANLKPLSSTTNRIEDIREAQPSVIMKAECYHYETRTRTVYYTDANGNQQSRLETYTEKVVTGVYTEPFIFGFWYDNSKSTLLDIRKTGVTKIKMKLDVLFGDVDTATQFYQSYSEFQKKYRNYDAHVDYSYFNVVPGFEKRLAAYIDPTSRPWWMTSVCYWISTVFCFLWPYRWMFNRSTGRTEYKVVKVIYVNRPQIQQPQDGSQSVDRPPSYFDLATCMKSRIQTITENLISSATLSDDSLQINWNSDEHINVQLREATI